MKFSLVALALTVAGTLASPIVPLNERSTTVTFEYYPAAGCKANGVSATVSKCTNLDSAANSFKVTGTKLPDGCTLQGFEDKGCSGFENQYIDGPSLNKCDKAINSSGKFKSVKLKCN